MRKVPKLFHQWHCVSGAAVSSDVSYESARGGAHQPSPTFAVAARPHHYHIIKLSGHKELLLQTLIPTMNDEWLSHKKQPLALCFVCRRFMHRSCIRILERQTVFVFVPLFRYILVFFPTLLIPLLTILFLHFFLSFFIYLFFSLPFVAEHYWYNRDNDHCRQLRAVGDSPS